MCQSLFHTNIAGEFNPTKKFSELTFEFSNHPYSNIKLSILVEL